MVGTLSALESAGECLAALDLRYPQMVIYEYGTAANGMQVPKQNNLVDTHGCILC